MGCCLLQQESEVKGQTPNVPQTFAAVLLPPAGLSVLSRAAPKTLEQSRTRRVNKQQKEEAVTKSHDHPHLSDTRPQKSAWRTRTRGRQQTTGIRQSLSIRPTELRDSGSTATRAASSSHAAGHEALEAPWKTRPAPLTQQPS